MALERYGVERSFESWGKIIDKNESPAACFAFRSVGANVFAGRVFFVLPFCWFGHGTFLNFSIVSTGRIGGICGRQHFLYLAPDPQMHSLLRGSLVRGFQSNPGFGLRPIID